LLLDLPPEAAEARARKRDGNRSDRIGSRSPDYHAAVAATFRDIADAEPDRVRRVDASGSPEEVTERLMAQLEELL
jgi:dTMP kinase